MPLRLQPPWLPVPAGGVHSNTSRMLRVLSMQWARLGCSNVNTSWGEGRAGQGRAGMGRVGGLNTRSDSGLPFVGGGPGMQGILCSRVRLVQLWTAPYRCCSTRAAQAGAPPPPAWARAGGT